MCHNSTLHFQKSVVPNQTIGVSNSSCLPGLQYCNYSRVGWASKETMLGTGAGLLWARWQRAKALKGTQSNDASKWKSTTEFHPFLIHQLIWREWMLHRLRQLSKARKNPTSTNAVTFLKTPFTLRLGQSQTFYKMPSHGQKQYLASSDAGQTSAAGVQQTQLQLLQQPRCHTVGCILLCVLQPQLLEPSWLTTQICSGTQKIVILQSLKKLSHLEKLLIYL